jgi:hypothetical protein
MLFYGISDGYKQNIEKRIEALKEAGNPEAVLRYISDEFKTVRRNSPSNKNVIDMLVKKRHEYILSLNGKMEAEKIKKLMRDHHLDFNE